VTVAVHEPFTTGRPRVASDAQVPTGARASALYEGVVRHRRFAPVRHEFSSRIVMTLLDLAEIDELIDDLPLWSRRRAAPVRFRRRDYLDGTDRPMVDALGDIVEGEIGRRPTGPVRMLTHVRTWGWIFNPISVFWCFDASGQPDIVVLEVTNTPWKERHWYVVEADAIADRRRVFPKALHVSPFMGMDLDYRFAFTPPTSEPDSPLTVRVELLRAGRKAFDAELSLTRVELTRRHAVTVLVRHPLQTLRVSAGIHWQAARLWTKRVPYVRHPTAAISTPVTPGAPVSPLSPLSPASPVTPLTPDAVDRATRTVLWKLLARAEGGHIVIDEDGGDRYEFGTREPDAYGRPATSVHARVHDARTYRAVLTGGSAALGHAYLQGWWDVDDLTGFLRLLSREVHRYDPARNGFARTIGRGIDLARSRRKPDKHRDRANIRAHYDLSNEFFALMLDDTMMYSSAYFASSEVTLGEASTEKLDRLCRRMALGPGDHVVEIGTGWGGFAVHAASRYGCRVTTTTISQAQFEFATARVAEASLAHLVDVRHDDYRDLDGTYDKLVSIEMIEAVDWRELDTFFASCEHLLKPDGIMGLQAIVIPAQRYERAKNTEDFIKAFIFPGGCLPSLEAIARSTAKVTDLTITDVDDFGLHYAETLRRWRSNVHGRLDELPALGLDESFQRMWDFYLAYCEAAFDEREISVVQCVLARPGSRLATPGGHAGA
jgi:cyclopropane-fatty-acyl-phospholipid synthase